MLRLNIDNDLKKALTIMAVTLAVIAATLIFFKLAAMLAPFLIAFALSMLMEPVIRLAEKRLHLGRKASVPLILLIILALPGYLAVSLISRLFFEIKGLVYILPSILSVVYTELKKIMDKVSNMQGFPPELTVSLDNLFQSLSSTVSRLADTLFKGVFDTAVSLPEAFIFILITVVAAYFMSSDRERITRYINRKLPVKWTSKIRSVRNDMFSVLAGYVRATLLMMLITFFELFIGFSIIRVGYALLLAFIIAIIDALPLIGTGSILIPWSLFCYVSGDFRMGASLLVLYAIIIVVRQLIEPKILSKQIGLHPLLALASMYLGLQLAGVAGFILGPMVFLLIRSILSTFIRSKKKS